MEKGKAADKTHRGTLYKSTLEGKGTGGAPSAQVEGFSGGCKTKFRVGTGEEESKWAGRALGMRSPQGHKGEFERNLGVTSSH